MLEEILDLEEIKVAVRSCESNKAPCYDSFNVKFIKEMWDTIREDIIELVRNFFITGEFPKLINTTCVSLVPKKCNSCCIEDFRSILVIRCLYKFISKLLANRLKLVTRELISDNQSSLSKRDSFLMAY